MIVHLKELRRNASLENASFGFRGNLVTCNGKTMPVDDFIKERTRLHRETWILPWIDQVIAWAEGEDVEWYR